MNGRRAARHAIPALPVLGWSAYSGERRAPFPAVLSVRYHRYTISGRAAIGLALYRLGVKPGSKVLVPTYHCPTMIAPVVHADLQPAFYPITARGGPDLNWLRQADLANVSALLATHYFGLPQPMAQVRAFCDQRGIRLIEDCAHAFFGITDGRSVGGWGDIAIASLTKFFPVPEGGLIASATLPMDALHLTPRRWRDEIKGLVDAIEVGAEHGRFPGLNMLLGGVFNLKNRLRKRNDVVAPAIDGDGRVINATIPQRLLSSEQPVPVVRWIVESVHWSRIVALRRRNYAELVRLLSGISGARVLQADLPDNAAPYVFPLYVDEPAVTYQRLRAARIPIFRWDEIWPGTPTLEGDHGMEWSTHVFQLGCHQDLSVEHLEAIADTVRGIIQSS